MKEYIEREKAREAVWQILNGMGYSEKHNDRLVEEVDAILDDIPAADVRPVARGKWIQKKSWTRGVCSACSWEIAFVTGNSYNFCPNCGADMREES